MRICDNIEDVTEVRVRALCSVVAKNTAIDMARKKWTQHSYGGHIPGS